MNIKNEIFEKSLEKLNAWVEKNGYYGWDPYDWGYAPISNKLPYYLNFLMSQINVYSPFNLRKFFGIKKGVSNKEIALFSQAYLLQYLLKDNEFSESKSLQLLSMLYERRIEREGGISWPSYYFSFVRKGHKLSPNNPDIIATSEALKAYTMAYYLFKNEAFKDISIKVINEIKRSFIMNGDQTHIKYYPQESEKIVFNVSGLVLSSFSYFLKYVERDNKVVEIGRELVKLLINSQNDEGFWPYSYYLKEKTYKLQIDYHQGFILDGLVDFYEYFIGDKDDLEKIIKRGVNYYVNNQYNSEGWSYYRPPKFKYPIDIHNQAQGIITFSNLYKVFKYEWYLDFAMKIAEWTIKNMQSPEGYFYTHRWPFIVNKMPYIRWGQAWMMLALSKLGSVMTNETNSKH